MKLISTIFLFLLTLQLQAQLISGKVIDSSSEKPLEYVNLGVIDTPLGITTNEKGEFSLDVKGQSLKAIVRISMIGYKPQTFPIEALANKENSIKLINNPVQLAEITAKPFSGKQKIIGTTDIKHGGLGGWGGTQYGSGHEIGTKLELGSSPIFIKSFHIYLVKQSFECSVLRLHIRSIVDNLPSEELLTENILIQLTKKSGWINIDLKKYNLVFSGDVALSLEWVNVIGLKRLIRVNGVMGANIHFRMNDKQGHTYARWGTEAKWTYRVGMSPCYYLTVQE